MTAGDAAPIIGPTPEPEGDEEPLARDRRARTPRLARHLIRLPDGHEVSLAVCGHGVALVVTHGFLAEGILYAQTLSRLVEMGFKVIAIDTAGHGGTQGLSTGGGKLGSYADLLGRVLDELGIGPAVMIGHSMGGRLVTELVANECGRAIAVILIDAIVGETWDRMVDVCRLAPPLMGALAAFLAVDIATTGPVLRDRRQALKLAKLFVPTLIGHVRRPWRLAGPAVSILRSRGSRWMLERLAQERIPVVVIHGDRDFVAPLATGRAAANRAEGELVVVHGATHSWLLKDPETLPAIMGELMDGQVGDAVRATLTGAGLDPDTASPAEIEAVLYRPGARVLDLTPRRNWDQTSLLHARPRYRWTRH